MKVVVLLALGALAACGADGDPVPPEPRERDFGPGVRFDVTGSAEMGIASR